MEKKNNQKFKVAVRCMTYNHSKYITDAMNGFTMQQTNFPFVCMIVDDASTDGEQEVIKKYVAEHFDMSPCGMSYKKDTDYAHIIFAQHKRNENCFFAVLFLKENHYSQHKNKNVYLKEWRDVVKYEAFCEGDDYWTVSDKLQSQYDALESHPECTIAYNRVKAITVKEKKERYSIPYKGCLCSTNKVNLLDLMNEEFYSGHWAFHTSSFFVRKGYLEKYLEFRKSLFVDFPYGDMPLQLTCLLNGYGYLVQNTMGCYRLFSGGYNSMLKENKQIKRNHLLRLINAYDKFDKYTEYKYHKQIQRKILRNQYEIDIIDNVGISWLRFRKKYWCFISKSTFKIITKEILKINNK